MRENDIEKRIQAILDGNEPLEEHNTIAVTTAGSGNVDPLVRSGTRVIDAQQQREIHDRIENLARIDCLIGPVLNPKDPRPHEERRDAARRGRRYAFRNAFGLQSYKNLIPDQYDEAMAWLEQQKHRSLDALMRRKRRSAARGRIQGYKPLVRSLRLITLLMVALAVPLLFSAGLT